MSNGSNQAGGRLPRWAKVVDAVAIAALLLAVSVLLTGGFIARFGPIRLSVHSPWRALLVAAVLLGVRHARVPGDPLHRRLGAWLLALGSEPGASVVSIAVGSRVAVLLVGFVAVLAIGPPKPGEFIRPHDALLNLPDRYDAGWYGSIAIAGYQFQGRFDRQQNFAFFPAYPAMLRIVGYGVGAFQSGVAFERRTARALWGGVLISVVAFVWAALYFARLARDTIGEGRAADAVALLAAYPFALYFSAPYTEAVFLLGTVAAFDHYRRREWLPAGLWGALVGVTRPNGCLLSLVLACVAVEHLWRTPRPAWREYPLARALGAAAMPGLAMLAHSAYVRHLTGDWFGWARVQIAWGRSFQGFATVSRGLERLEHEGLLGALAAVPVETLNALALIFALAMVWPVFRRVGLAAAVFVLVNVLPPVLSGGVLSMARFTSTLFPIFLALAAMLPRPLVVPVLIAFGIGQGLATALFFTWRPLF